ncbi:MAG: ectoine/hydroxyectoine ABC transporter permease subunit EhuD [Proteobacteria bacterium]|nr:ectoine/hydroxyectoine ABC transporter permease subunit EhuD [Pseudomonadota bacterium]
MDEPVFDWSYTWEIAPRLLDGLVVTVQATVLATVIATLLGLVLAIGRRSRQRIVAWFVAVVVEFIRSTPLLVQLYFLFFVLPSVGVVLSPLQTGAIGLGVHYAAYMSEVYRAGIESVPRQQWEGAVALGFSRRRTWLSIVLPQAIPPVIPALGNYVVALFKETPLLSAITVVELMQVAQIEGSRSFRYLEAFTLVGVMFLALSTISAAGVRILELRLARS